MDFPDGKMFQTLLESDLLFENPGLTDHEGAQQYLIDRERSPLNSRPAYGNSLEIGFKAFIRNTMKDVFKEKSLGLVLRNFEVHTVHSCPKPIRKRFGEFLDDILNVAQIKENSAGRLYFELDRFRLEDIKDKHVSFLTDEKSGTFPIDIYTKDVLLFNNNWLIRLLEFNSYSWESITMMRYKSRAEGHRLSHFFFQSEINQYNNAQTKLQKIYRDATIAPPGPISRALTTPLNTSWYWDEMYFTIKAKETWDERNLKSDIVMPVTLDKMIEILLEPMTNNNLRISGSNPDLVYEYHGSLCNAAKDPCKFLKVVSQIQGRVEVQSKEHPDAFLDREREETKILQYPERDHPHYNRKFVKSHLILTYEYLF